MIKSKFELHWKHDLEPIAVYATLEEAYNGLKQMVSIYPETIYDDFDVWVIRINVDEPVFLEHEL